MKDYIGFRDAIHVPFIVTTCDVDVCPGEKLSLRESEGAITCVKWRRGDAIPWHGIADMFGEDVIHAKQPFRLYLRKECFSRLRHDFSIETNDSGGTATCHQVCNIN